VYIGIAAGDSAYRNQELTDARGRFVFTDLPAVAGYYIATSAPGYAGGGLGSQGALSGRISLADGQWFSAANVSMMRLSTISGMVTDEHGDPVSGVTVRVLSSVFAAGLTHLASGQAAKTDDRGIYRIAGLKPGNYVVNVPSVQSTVPAAELDKPGDPASGSPVDPDIAFVSIDNETRLAVGVYATPPPSAGRPQSYPPVFYPGALTAAGATPIELRAGDERSGVDFRIEPVPSFRITGRLEGPPDSITGQVVRLVPAGSEDLGFGSEAATALTTTAGAFTLANVPTGAYTISVGRTTAQFEQSGDLTSAVEWFAPMRNQPAGLFLQGMSGARVTSASNAMLMTVRSPGSDSHFGRLPIVVRTRDIDDLVVPMRRAARIAGSVVWDGPPPPNWGVSSLAAEPARGSPALGSHPNQSMFDVFETFSIDGLGAGEYVLRATNVRSGGLVKSVRSGDRDFTESAFDASSGGDFTNVVITLTTNVPIATGAVRNGRSPAGSEFRVLAFPVEREQWTGYGLTPARIALAAIVNGAYRMANLPEGNYYLVAVDSDQSAAWRDPAWLDIASRVATRVALRWGETTAQDLAVVPIK
jgi:hypothetical protein